MPSDPEIPSDSRHETVAPHDRAPTRRERAAATGSRAAMGVVRFIALAGIVGSAVIAGTIMSDRNVQGWVEGLVIGLGAVVLSAIVFSSRRLARRD